MAKALKIIGTVVAVVGTVAAGIALTVGTGGAFLGVAAATFGTIATVAGIVGAVIGIASTFIKPGFQGGGNPLAFQTNPQSGLPYGIGRTRMSGLRIHAETYSGTKGKSKQDILAFAVLLSAGGQIDAIESFRADKAAITFNAGTGAAIGTYANYMAQKVSLGAPAAPALSLSFQGGNFPGWSASHKLTGMAHALWDLRYDKEGEFFTAGVPEPEWVGRWNRVYDPRLDSTYPGGSGACRALDETTYVFSRNPALHALTWALGRWQNSKRTVGIGAPVANIRVGDFVEAANIADANEWYCGGIEWSTESKWAVLKRMLQAGGAVPTMTGAMIGCRAYAPRVSVATIEARHVMDSLSVSVTAPRRERINSIIPRYRSENHEWEIISGSPITVGAYVTVDGGLRRRELDLPLVQNESAFGDGDTQAGQLAAYEIVNAREAAPITFTTGPEFIGLKCGDCVTINVPEEGLDNQDIVLTEVSFDPATAKIRFSAISETADKHAFALGQSTTPPPAFTLDPPDLLPPAPGAALWAVSPSNMGDGLPAITVEGASEYPSGTDVVIRYKASASADWLSPIIVADDQGTITYQIGPLDETTAFDIELAYRNEVGQGPWLSLGPVTTAANDYLTALEDALAAAAARGRLFFRPTAPTAAESALGDTWIDNSGIFYDRVPGGILLKSGGVDKIIVLGGFRPSIYWTRSVVQPLEGTIDVANEAVLAAAIAQAQVDVIASDAWLSTAEKPTLKIIHEALIKNHVALNAKAVALGVAATERTNATAAVNALNAYLSGLSPSWSDVSVDTPWVGATARGYFDDAHDKVAILQAAIQGLPGPTGATGAPGADGTDGIDGTDGKLVEFVWKRAATAPSAPTGNGIPATWSDDPPTGTDPLWMSKAKQELDGTLVTGESWSTPIRHDGPAGNYVETRYKRSASVPSSPTGDDPADWFISQQSGEERQWRTTGTKSADGVLLSSWATPVSVDDYVSRGAYAAGTAYIFHDTVTHNGGTYFLKVASSTGNAPTGTAEENSYWGVLAAPGAGAGSGSTTLTIDLTSSSTGRNLRTVADAAGYTGGNATITFEVESGVNITGAAGQPGIDTGTWPTSSFTIALTISIKNGGIVRGGGGNGGYGANSPGPGGGGGPWNTPGGVGGAGGDAIYCRVPISGGITIDSGGTLQGGGGGGGGGRGRTSYTAGEYFGTGGDGGGGGAPNGDGGSGGFDQDSFIDDGAAGNAGTTGGGGSGDGDGGTYATAGTASGLAPTAAGGAAGYAVRKNGNAVTVTNNGTMAGTAA